MENFGTTCYVILSIIGVIGLGILYMRFALKKSIRNRHLVQDFFSLLSKNYEKAWTKHYQDDGAKVTVARAINTKIRANMEQKFPMLIHQMYCFPRQAFAFSTTHSETNRYIVTMYAEFKTLYKDYKGLGAGPDVLEKEFYRQSELAIIAALEKAKK